MSLSKKQLGNIGEEKAYQFLTQQGLKLIEKNFYSRFGEIDLIMLESLQPSIKWNPLTNKENCLVFVEVRSRKNMGFGSALESITISKQQKLRKTANFFLLKNVKYSKMTARFDVIIIPPITSEKQIYWLKNAF
ncbi:MAG: YraN family protein [Pseudomonadota bacterium]